MILVKINIIIIYANVRLFISEINSTVNCYSSIVVTKLKIWFHLRKSRICNRWCQFVLSNDTQVMVNFIRLHIQSETPIDQFVVCWKYKISSHCFWNSFSVSFSDNNVMWYWHKSWTKEKTAVEHFSCYHWNVNSHHAIHHYSLKYSSEIQWIQFKDTV